MTIGFVLAQKAARIVLIGTVIGAGILAGLFGTRSASAAVANPLGPNGRTAEIDICESDPIITMTTLSGVTRHLTVTASISTAPRNVQGVSYEIHLPLDVAHWSISYPAGDLSQSREHVTVTTDAPSGHYISRITVDSNVHVALSGTAAIDARSISRSGTTDRSMRLHLRVR